MNHPRYFALVALALLGSVAGPRAAQSENRSYGKLKEHILQKRQEGPVVGTITGTDEAITAPGNYSFSIQHDGLQRMYKVHVPPSYSASKPMPVLVALHGAGGNMDALSQTVRGLVPKSDKEGFIAVFPNGYSRFPSGKLATWNAGTCCGDALDRQVDDVGFIRAIIQNLSAQMRVDRARIFAIGMSNGGMMAYRLACEMPDMFKAVASVAGTDVTTRCNPGRPVSILHIHALNDDRVLFNGGIGKSPPGQAPQTTGFPPVPDAIARWVERNHCQDTPERILNVTGAYCDLYASCHGGTKIQLCVTEDGGHSWPIGNRPTSRRHGRASQTISANDRMWDFFMSL